MAVGGTSTHLDCTQTAPPVNDVFFYWTSDTKKNILASVKHIAPMLKTPAQCRLWYQHRRRADDNKKRDQVQHSCIDRAFFVGDCHVTAHLLHSATHALPRPLRAGRRVGRRHHFSFLVGVNRVRIRHGAGPRVLRRGGH